MAEVIDFTGSTILDLPPDKILSAAIEEKLESVVICGLDANGDFYLASSSSYVPDNLFLIERAKMALMEIEDAE